MVVNGLDHTLYAQVITYLFDYKNEKCINLLVSDVQGCGIACLTDATNVAFIYVSYWTLSHGIL